jgi:hypothetical protein
MWQPRRLTTLWASTACYRDSVAFFHIDSSFETTTGVGHSPNFLSWFCIHIHSEYGGRMQLRHIGNIAHIYTVSRSAIKRENLNWLHDYDWGSYNRNVTPCGPVERHRNLIPPLSVCYEFTIQATGRGKLSSDCHRFDPEDGGSMLFRNVTELLPDHMASHSSILQHA